MAYVQLNGASNVCFAISIPDDRTILVPDVDEPIQEAGLVTQEESLTDIQPRSRCGRPTKYCPSVVATICEAVADGTPFKFAAALGGISVDTFYEWKKQYPDFSDAIEQAQAKGVHERLKLIKAAAEKGDVRSAQWWLEHVLPEHFARNRIEQVAQVAVSVETKTDPEQLERMREAYRRAVIARHELERSQRRSVPSDSLQR